MAQLQVTCTVQEPAWAPTRHAHIVRVGVAGGGSWTKQQVILAIKLRQHTFYTVDPLTGKVALVQVVACRQCGGEIIRSAPDATLLNNLDSLPRCG
jgi:Protein of unknown function (DUF3892)